jgi:hypothetical protein
MPLFLLASDNPNCSPPIVRLPMQLATGKFRLSPQVSSVHPPPQADLPTTKGQNSRGGTDRLLWRRALSSESKADRVGVSQLEHHLPRWFDP